MADSLDARSLAWCGWMLVGCSVGVDVEGIASVGSQVSAVGSSAPASEEASSSSSGSTDDGGTSNESEEGPDAPPEPPAPVPDATSTTDSEPVVDDGECATFCAALAACGLAATDPPPPQGCEPWCSAPWDEGPCDAAWLDLAACLAGEPCGVLAAYVKNATVPIACGDAFDSYLAACLP